MALVDEVNSNFPSAEWNTLVRMLNDGSAVSEIVKFCRQTWVIPKEDTTPTHLHGTWDNDKDAAELPY